MINESPSSIPQAPLKVEINLIWYNIDYSIYLVSSNTLQSVVPSGLTRATLLDSYPPIRRIPSGVTKLTWYFVESRFSVKIVHSASFEAGESWTQDPWAWKSLFSVSFLAEKKRLKNNWYCTKRILHTSWPVSVRTGSTHYRSPVNQIYRRKAKEIW